MKKLFFLMAAAFVAAVSCENVAERTSVPVGEMLLYHEIRVDENGNIVPWFSDDPATAYDDVLNRIWTFWDTMKVDYNGLPYYMNHLAWCPEGYIDRGIGGDQIAMCLSSWNLLYLYTGNIRIRENMQFMAGYYLAHSLSPSDCKWPNLPFPQNTNIYSGEYDGDMILGPGYLQPDKAASFAWELLQLSHITIREPQKSLYFDAAVKIANSLAERIRPGDGNHSPWPFKVNAYTGEVGRLKSVLENIVFRGSAEYTTNYAPAIELYLALAEEVPGNRSLYRKTAERLIAWMNEYPVKTGKWGPFFEDVPGWSDTQINAVTYAQFLMNHPDLDEDWKVHVRSILDWVYKKLGNNTWAKYGVTAINEQTFYTVPGNSHTARQACAEIQYCSMTGDSSYLEGAIRQLNWATYMVSDKGWNRYPQDDIWLTDGYGDYVRHYLRAMAAYPDIAPAESHILSSSSGILSVDYSNGDDYYNISYVAAKNNGEEVIRLKYRPESVTFEKNNLKTDIREGQSDNDDAWWQWFDCIDGGFMVIFRKSAATIEIYGKF